MMDEDDTVRKLSRIELRKQKLMEYLATKGKLKPPNPKPYLRDDSIKHKKPEGKCPKTCNSDEGKENQGREPPRFHLAEGKPQPSTGMSRAPFSHSANVNRTRATDCSRFPAPATTCPAATVRVKPQRHSAVPGLAAPLAANDGHRVTEPIRAGFKTLTSSRNVSKASTTGRTVTQPQNRARTIPVAARTAPTKTALAKTGPVAPAQARKCPIATAQPRLQSARVQPGTNFQTKTRSNTAVLAGTHPRTSGLVRVRSDTIASARTGQAPAKNGNASAALPNTGTATTSKPGPCKGPSAKAPPGVHRPALTAPTNRTGTSLRKKSDIGTSGNKTHCSAFQKKASGQTVKAAPVLRSIESVTNTKPAQHGQSLPSTFKVSVNKPQAKASRGPVRSSTLPKRTTLPPGPNPKGAAPQRSRTGGRPLAPASCTGGGGEGPPVKALQRAMRQAVSRMRGEGLGRPVSGTEGEGRGTACTLPKPEIPTPRPSGRVAFAGVQREDECCGVMDGVPSTVPRSARRSCRPLGPADLKTPARTAGAEPGPGLIGTAPPRDRKLSAAQEQRLQKLQEWRQSKGISYKRPPMPVRPRGKKAAAPTTPHHYWTTMEEEEEAQSLVYNIDRSLTDCIKLLQEGCPSEQVTQVLSGVPMAKKFAKYWICQARLMEREGNLEVLPMFEEAVRVVLEPVDDLRTVVFEILKKKEEVSAEEAGGVAAASEGEGQKSDEEEDETRQAAAADPVTPGPTSAVIRGAKGGSSVVKYKITATPGGRRSQQQEPVTLDGQELRFFTPVRRSVRIERSAPRYPSALREHDPCVASFRDLLAEEESEGQTEEGRSSPLYVYRENEALRDQVQVQLYPTSGPSV